MRHCHTVDQGRRGSWRGYGTAWRLDELTSDAWMERKAALSDHAGSLGGVVGNGLEWEEWDAARICHYGDHLAAQTDFQVGCHEK
jgi:hypothetical protein